jgi:sugar lactone lactonase YvrE
MNTKMIVALSSLVLVSTACSEESSMPGAVPPGGATENAMQTKVLASFDPAAGELPEGVAMKEGFAYAGFAPTGVIAKVDLQSGKYTTFANLPKPVPNKGFMTGLTFGADGSLYAALVSFDPTVQPGIYRVPAEGGQAKLFAKDAHMVFPNGLVFDAAGALFVTDSAAGTIYKITRSGAVSAWASSELLTGDDKECGGSGNGFPIGANGLVARDGAFYATNTDKGSIIRVEIKADGSAGTPALAAGPDCAALAGADGLTTDAEGNLIAAVNRQNKVVRLTRTGAVEVVAAGDTLDFPASLTWDASTAIATNFALANASSGKPAKPGLLGITKR